MAVADTVKPKDRNLSTPISWIVLGFIAVSVANLVLAIVFATKTKLLSQDGLNFSYPTEVTTNIGFWEQINQIPNGSHRLRFNWAAFALAFGPTLMSIVYAMVYFTNEKHSIHEIWVRYTRSGFDMLQTLWAIFAEGPLLVYLLFVLGERRYEVVLFTWLLVIYTGSLPSMFASWRKMRDENKRLAENAENALVFGSTIVPAFVAFCTYVASIFLVWLLFINLSWGQDRMWDSKVARVTKNFNIAAFAYAVWWLAYRLFILGVSMFRDHATTNNDNDRSDWAVWAHFCNWIAYSCILLYTGALNLVA